MVIVGRHAGMLLAVTIVACGEHAPQFDDARNVPSDVEVDGPAVDAPRPGTFVVVRDITGTVGYCDTSNAPCVVGSPTASWMDGCCVDTTNPAGKAGLALVFDNAHRTAMCRQGHVPEVDNAEFRDCPTAAADGTVTLFVTPTLNATDGRYRADVYYADENGTNQTYTTAFYVHRSLNGAKPCPHSQAFPWPSDARIFAEAIKPHRFPTMSQGPSWIDAETRLGTLPHAVAFASSSSVTPPFYNLHFSGAWRTSYRTVAAVDSSMQATVVNLGNATDFDVPIWSLRHRISFSANRTLAIIVRRYESRTGRPLDPTGPSICTMGMDFGTTYQRTCPAPGGGVVCGGTFPTLNFDCDAIVLNSAGEGYCMTIDEDGPHKAVFSRAMAGKVSGQSVGASTPKKGHDTFWSPKVFSLVDAPYADDLYQVPKLDPPVVPIKDHSTPLILRP